MTRTIQSNYGTTEYIAREMPIEYYLVGILENVYLINIFAPKKRRKKKDKKNDALNA